jgi:dTDP-4-dehydrorhamnose 3,5-epimerase
VLDVAVDIRHQSPTYGQHLSVELSESNMEMLYIPEGFAHGFLTLQDNTIFCYKCSNLYHKTSEDCLIWNDPDLAINWNTIDPIVSAKDKEGKAFRGFKSLF